jgi:hypothetical protein
MSTDARKAALEKKHAAIEAELAALTSHPSVDTLSAVQLKREKLRLKDEIARLKA